MNLTQLFDSPELTVTIGGQSYSFGEIPIAQYAELQAWMNAHLRHPLDELKGKLEGLPPKVQAEIADRARIEAKNWPPKIESLRGKQALMESDGGQVEAFRVALQKFQPGLTAEESKDVYRQFERETIRRKDEKLATRVFSVMFGLGDDGETDDPKAPTS